MFTLAKFRSKRLNLFSSYIEVSCDFEDCLKKELTNQPDISLDEFISCLEDEGWGFNPENEDIFYCQTHYQSFMISDVGLEPKNWHIAGNRFVCNEHKIPECDMHEIKGDENG